MPVRGSGVGMKLPGKHHTVLALLQRAFTKSNQAEGPSGQKHRGWVTHRRHHIICLLLHLIIIQSIVDSVPYHLCKCWATINWHDQ